MSQKPEILDEKQSSSNEKELRWFGEGEHEDAVGNCIEVMSQSMAKVKSSLSFAFQGIP